MAPIDQGATAPMANGVQHITASLPRSPHVITQETLLYEPLPNDIVSYKNSTSQAGRIRKIFLNTPLDDKEQEWLSAMRVHIRKEGLTFDASQEKDFLRFLQHSKGDVAGAVSLLQANDLFRQEFVTGVKDTDILPILQSGFMYWHGRDKCQRPILVVRTALLDPNIQPGDIVRVVSFILEWMIEFGLVPGRVENWTVLVDLKDTGLASVGMETVKTLVTSLHMNYRFRNTKVVIMNCPWIGSAIYKMISPLLPADTKEKVTFCSVKAAASILAEVIDLRQLEERFGGTAPNCDKPTDFYPYKFFADLEPSTTKSINERYPLKYLTSGRLWELHKNAPSGVAQWLSQVDCNDFFTDASCAYLKDTTGRELQPARDIDRHLALLNDLIPTVSVESRGSIKRQNSVALAEAVIAKRGGVEIDESFERAQDEAAKDAEAEIRTRVVALCNEIAAAVNSGDSQSAVQILQAHDEAQEKIAQDAILLDSATATYCMVELQRKSEMTASTLPSIPDEKVVMRPVASNDAPIEKKQKKSSCCGLKKKTR